MEYTPSETPGYAHVEHYVPHPTTCYSRPPVMAPYRRYC